MPIQEQTQVLLTLQPQGSYYKWKQNLAEQRPYKGKHQTYIRYMFHNFLYPISPPNGSGFFLKCFAFHLTDLRLSGRQQPVLSCFCMMCSKTAAQMKTQHCRSKPQMRWKGWDIQTEHADFCLKCDYKQVLEVHSTRDSAAIGQNIYLGHWGTVAARQVCSAKKMQGKQLAARCDHPRVQPFAPSQSAAPRETLIMIHRFIWTAHCSRTLTWLKENRIEKG